MNKIFSNVIGQSRVQGILASSLEKKQLAHAYLFHGPDGVGKDAMALALAKTLNCQQNAMGGCGVCSPCQQIQRLDYPGFHLVLPVPSRPKSLKENKYRELVRERSLQRIAAPYESVSFLPELSGLPLISIHQVRAMKQEVMLKLSAPYRVFLISQAHRMNPAAANSLLKLLEEPPRGTLLFLTTSKPGELLDTIRSRCQAIRFDSLPEEEIQTALQQRFGFEETASRFLARMAGGSVQQALTMSEEAFTEQRETAWAFLKTCVSGNEMERIQAGNEWLAAFDKGEMPRVLHLLQIWIRDILLTQHQRPNQAMNIDRQPDLNEFVARYPDFNAEEALAGVDRAIDFIGKNVYLQLIVFGLSQELERCANRS